MQPPLQLVFTIALKEELPISWLRYHDIGVFTIQGLMAGALKGLERRNSLKKSILFIITGVGINATREAALWIREHIRPLFVVNIGTAGSVDSKIGKGEWVIPDSVINEKGKRLYLDTRIPFPWPESQTCYSGGTLMSVARPVSDSHPHARKDFQYIDMESFAQAEVFCGTGISYHVIKWISDFSDRDTKRDFKEALRIFPEEITKVLSFLKEEKRPEVAVIVPVHNRREWLTKCVQSVIEQTLPPKEVIIVDDGSRENIRDALSGYEDQVVILSQPANKGVSAARNLGVTHSSSPWICFLDSDDLWKADKLEKQWEFIKIHPFYEILQCKEIWIRNGRRVNPCKHHKKPEGWIWEKSLERCLISPSAVMMKRRLFERAGGFDEDLPVCEDYDLWLRISRNHVVGLDPSESVIKHGGHEDQLSRRYSAMDSFRVQALLKALREEVDPSFRDALLKVLKKKLSILIKGSKKRMKVDRWRRYEAILTSLETVEERKDGDQVYPC